ncbi:hypothetical protein L1049_027087 [Liquidambar formosana]|uniref:Uncharacterized protein n=1 Tax=Liquidambar formosana TaxID=63359 RepID=A0AAP0N6Y7_LIQFO
MDTTFAKPACLDNKPLSTTVNNQKEEVGVIATPEEDNESSTLLSKRRGGISKGPRESCLKVQWNDRNGKELVEVLRFEYSDESNTDDENSDSCNCAIM